MSWVEPAPAPGRGLLDALLPFSFTVVSSGRIRWVGRSLAKLLRFSGRAQSAGELSAAPGWSHWFELERPELPDLSPESLAGQLLVLKCRPSPSAGGVQPRFRGQVVLLDSEAGEWLFALSPTISDLREVARLGLDYGDFAAGDPVFDFLMLLQSEKRSHSRSEQARVKLLWEGRLASVLHELALMASVATPWKTAARSLVERICRELEWEFGHLWLEDPERAVLKSSGSFHCSEPVTLAAFVEATLGESFGPGEGLPGRVREEGKSIWSDDFNRDARFLRRRVLPNPGIWCGVGLPIFKGGRVVAVLEFFSSRRQAAGTELMRFFETVATQLGGILEKEELLEREHEKEALLRASANLSSLGEMAAGISHEINNPLTAIVLGASQAGELLAREQAEANADGKDLDSRSSGALLAKILDRIQRSADRIQKIVAGMRTLSRDGSGDPFVRQPVTQLIEDTLEICRARFSNGNVRVDVAYGGESAPAGCPREEKGEGCVILCRPVQVCQVLLNLLNNAYDAVHGNEGAWVRIGCSRDGDFTRIEVADSGNGIPAEVADKIMKPFFTTKPVGKGTGLGLSISRSIIAAHKGTLELDRSRPNTTFVVRIPRV